MHSTENTQLRQFVESVPTALVLYAADTSILCCNPMAEELMRLSEAEMLGKQAAVPDWGFVSADGSALPLEFHPVNRVRAMPSSWLMRGAARSWM